MPTKQAKQKKEDTNNDDPPELYDSDEDEKNEAWVEKHLSMAKYFFCAHTHTS